MTVYQLIQVLATYPADTPIHIHGAARAWEDANTARRAATTDVEEDAIDETMDAADDAEPVEAVGAAEWPGGRVVIS